MSIRANRFWEIFYFLGVIVFVNCASVRWATTIQVIFTGAKLLAIIILVITGLVRLGQGIVCSI